MKKHTDILDTSAEALSKAIHARRVSCREVMQATLDRIGALNPRFNALVNLAPAEQLLAEADARDADLAPRRTARGSSGWMHGMPQAIKDTGNAVGFPTTFGSPLLAQALPAQDSVFVQRMKAAGCIVIAKTNMPEFGLGSHTYNQLFGGTPNAWDDSVSAGGSSGGAAVALALRLLAVADGSDFMGSLRNPAGWNHIFGLRPSQGRVPAWPKPELFVSQLGTDGPMGRSVRDLAALLSTQAGHDPRAPLSLSDAPRSYVPTARQAATAAKGARIAWLGDLNGHLAVEPGILPLCEQALKVFEGAGARVEPSALGFDPAVLWDAWLLWRRALVAPAVAGAMKLAGDAQVRERVKPEALWEHDCGQDLSMPAFMQAAQVRSAFHAHMVQLLQRYDAVALPVAQVWPFAQMETWPKQINGRAMDTYHRWMEVTLVATFAGLPAISIPAGFDGSGRWPMGLQLIGRPQGDADLLALAAAYEARVPELLARRPAASCLS